MEVDYNLIDSELKSVPKTESDTLIVERAHEDEIAISDAIREVEENMERHESEERWCTVQEMRVDEVDSYLKDLQAEAALLKEQEEIPPEDAIAIAEAIDAVEDEMKQSGDLRSSSSQNTFIPLAVAVVGALVATKVVASFFFR